MERIRNNEDNYTWWHDMHPSLPVRPHYDPPRKEGRAHEATIPRSIVQETEDRMAVLDAILAKNSGWVDGAIRRKGGFLREDELAAVNEEYDRLEALQRKLKADSLKKSQEA